MYIKMKKVLKVVSLILLLCFAYQVLAIQTQVNKVTIADIRAAFGRKLSLDRMVTVVVGADTK